MAKSAPARKSTEQAARAGTPEKSEFLRFLEWKKLKRTRQRDAVANEIFRGRGHFEPEEIVQRLKKNRTRVSRATVYRTLELLRECQLVEKLDFGEAGALYEHVHLGEHHDHFICTRCGKVIEFHNADLEALQSGICAKYGFHDTHHSLRIFGECRECRGSRNS